MNPWFIWVYRDEGANQAALFYTIQVNIVERIAECDEGSNQAALFYTIQVNIVERIAQCDEGATSGTKWSEWSPRRLP